MTYRLLEEEILLPSGVTQEFSYLQGDWTSSNPSVATVNRAGVVEALSDGTTDISFTWGTLVSEVHPVTVGLP